MPSFTCDVKNNYHYVCLYLAGLKVANIYRNNFIHGPEAPITFRMLILLQCQEQFLLGGIIVVTIPTAIPEKEKFKSHFCFSRFKRELLQYDSYNKKRKKAYQGIPQCRRETV